jgi:hypothetical protein
VLRKTYWMHRTAGAKENILDAQDSRC